MQETNNDTAVVYRNVYVSNQLISVEPHPLFEKGNTEGNYGDSLNIIYMDN